MSESVRITVTISKEKAELLKQKAVKAGIPTPTYCRVLLSEAAEASK